MNNDDPELRMKLRRAADAVPAEPRWDDLTRRIDRAGRRRFRALSAVVVAALVAGPAAGFAAGRLTSPSTSPSSRVVLGETGSTVSSPPTTGTVPPTTMPGFGVEAGSNPGAGVPSEPMDRLFNRTAGQIALRVFGIGAGGGTCAPIDMTVEASSPSWISGSTTLVTTSAIPLLTVVGVHPAGQAEGGLATIVVVAVNSKVATVRLQIPGGGTDSMTADHGTAVLAAWAGQTAGTVQALGKSGQVLATAPVVQQPLPATSCVATTAATTPATTPATLPAPGAQPPDPAAAKADVLNAFAQVYQLNSPAGSAYVAGWTAAITDAMSKVMKQWTIKSVDAQVTDVVFTSPTTASVEYNLQVKPFGPFNSRIGNAVLDQGVWKVQASTVCNDIALGGGSC